MLLGMSNVHSHSALSTKLHFAHAAVKAIGRRIVYKNVGLKVDFKAIFKVCLFDWLKVNLSD